jgi:hypothetical protein
MRLLVNLRKIIEENCIASLCLVERGGVLVHKRFQMVVKGNFSSPPVLNTESRFVWVEI